MMNNCFERAVSSDTLGMNLENNWNASDEEGCMGADISFHIPDKLLMEHDDKQNLKQ